MKRKLLYNALILIVSGLSAQQDYQFSMNTFNRLAVNPAYAGINKTLCVTTFYRNQWMGFDGAPTTGLVSVDYGRVLHGGMGLTINQDQVGFNKLIQAKLAYAYHITLNRGTLAFGLDAGVMQQSITGGKFIGPDSQTDPSVPWGGASGMTYNLGGGIYYQIPRRFYIGVSSLQLPQQQFSASGVTNGANWNFSYQMARHYYIMAGYTIRAGRSWDITPSIFTKSVLATTQIDANLLFKWDNKLFFGASYRLNDAIIGMAGFDYRFSRKLNVKLGYAYDMTASNIKKYSNGTHELMLGFCYKIVPDPSVTRHMNVRFL